MALKKSSFRGLIDSCADGKATYELPNTITPSAAEVIAQLQADFAALNDNNGRVDTIVQGANITVDATDPINPIVSAASTGIQSLVQGTNITVDATDPVNPTINATVPDAVASIVAGDNITVDPTDPINPTVTADLYPDATLLTLGTDLTTLTTPGFYYAPEPVGIDPNIDGIWDYWVTVRRADTTFYGIGYIITATQSGGAWLNSRTYVYQAYPNAGSPFVQDWVHLFNSDLEIDAGQFGIGRGINSSLDYALTLDDIVLGGNYYYNPNTPGTDNTQSPTPATTAPYLISVMGQNTDNASSTQVTQMAWQFDQSQNFGTPTESVVFVRTNHGFATQRRWSAWTEITNQGGISSLVEGDNITIDNTDPANPIITAAAGGGGGEYTQLNSSTNLTTINANFGPGKYYVPNAQGGPSGPSTSSEWWVEVKSMGQGVDPVAITAHSEFFTANLGREWLWTTSSGWRELGVGETYYNATTGANLTTLTEGKWYVTNATGTPLPQVTTVDYFVDVGVREGSETSAYIITARPAGNNDFEGRQFIWTRPSLTWQEVGVENIYKFVTNDLLTNNAVGVSTTVIEAVLNTTFQRDPTQIITSGNFNITRASDGVEVGALEVPSLGAGTSRRMLVLNFTVATAVQGELYRIKSTGTSSITINTQ